MPSRHPPLGAGEGTFESVQPSLTQGGAAANPPRGRYPSSKCGRSHLILLNTGTNPRVVPMMERPIYVPVAESRPLFPPFWLLGSGHAPPHRHIRGRNRATIRTIPSSQTPHPRVIARGPTTAGRYAVVDSSQHPVTHPPPRILVRPLHHQKIIRPTYVILGHKVSPTPPLSPALPGRVTPPPY